MNISLKAKSSRDAIVLYLNVLYKFHKLTDKEIDTLAEIIIKYKQLEIKYDKDVASKLFLDKDSRKEIREKLKMEDQVFRNYLVVFRKKGILIQTGIIKGFIPNFKNINISVNIKYGE